MRHQLAPRLGTLVRASYVLTVRAIQYLRCRPLRVHNISQWGPAVSLGVSSLSYPSSAPHLSRNHCQPGQRHIIIF